MKSSILFILFATIGLSTLAQSEEVLAHMKEPLSVDVMESSLKIKKDNASAYAVYVHCDARDLEKKWKEYFEEKYTCEFEKAKGQYVASAIRMSDVTGETVNLIGVIDEDEKGAKLTMAVDLGVGYISSKTNPTESSNLKRVIEDFVNNYYVGWYDKVIDKERKVYEKSLKEQEKLSKEGERLQKNLENTEGKIIKAEDNITKSEKEIADLQLRIEQLKKDIETYKGEVQGLVTDIENKNTEVEEQKKVVAKNLVELEKLKANGDRVKAKQ